jgi:anti-sigma factor RsiW
MLDERLLEKLSAYADGELADSEAAALTAALEQDGELRDALAEFRRLDREAARLPVPEMPASAVAAVRKLLLGPESSETYSLHQAMPSVPKHVWAEALEPVPAPAPERWRNVWENILARARIKSASEVLPANLKPVTDRTRTLPAGLSRLWRWSAGLSAAAAVLVVAVLAFYFGSHRVDPPVAQPQKEILPPPPEGCFRVVKFLPGCPDPVVCFIVQDPGRKTPPEEEEEEE